MIKKFSSPKMQNRQFVFTPKIEYELVAKRCEANQNPLTFPIWCPRRESAATRKYFDSLCSQNTNEPQPPLGGSPPFASESASRRLGSILSIGCKNIVAQCSALFSLFCARGENRTLMGYPTRF